MDRGVEKLIDIWKRSYSNPLKSKSSYQSREQLRQIAALFSPGRTFYYILNFHDLKFEYVSEEVEEITGFSKDEVTLKHLLSISQDIPLIQQKENVVQDFAINHTEGDELLDYKFVYTYRLQKPASDPQTILLQNIAIGMSEEGNVQHALGIHTDVTHLKSVANDTISIISLKGGKSYYNISVEGGVFNPSTASNSDNNFQKLTNRETDIVRLLARGMNADQIAHNLHISVHTVRTHRNNMLKKLGCANSPELVVQCVASGLISV